MKRTLIVAEKPSQAREYAVALGVKRKGDGYLENDQYVITWCYGHLLELERPEAYMDLEQVGRRWSLRRLPVLPSLNDFRRVVKKESAKQYQVVLNWLSSSEITQVICGTDADREGQLLFQEIWDAANCRKPLSRLWISSLTTAAIREGLKNLRSAETVAGLAAAGNGRAFADWDFGMNLTEGFTALFGSFDTERKRPNVISIGRVQTPTLALIVEREWEIESFVPQQFYEVKAEFKAEQGNYYGKWIDPGDDTKRITDLQEAESIVLKTQGKLGSISEMEEKEILEPAPLLFDLTSLTIAGSKKYGYSAEKVLQLAQSLYEKKAITYPRTDCAYLSEDILPKLPAHLNAVCQEPYKDLADQARGFGLPKGKRVINTITAHHAIIPTTEKVVLERLNRDEQHLYDLIVRRFLAVWFPPARYYQTVVMTLVESETFRTKGKALLSLGWKAVYDHSDLKKHGSAGEEEEAALPPLLKGQVVQVKEVSWDEKSTKPPKPYTQGDLLKAMEGAGKQIDDEILRQQLKGKGLGTVATRPAIIESLIDRGYIFQKQKSLRPSAKGVELIRLIKEKLPEAHLLISAEMTGQMEYNLAKVEKGEIPIQSYMSEVENSVKRIVAELRSFEQCHGKSPLAFAPAVKVSRKGKKKEEGEKTVRQKEKTSDSSAQSLGKCPKCGSEVIEGQKGFGCSNWRSGCRFVLWKTPICGKTLTPNQIRRLLKTGKTPLIKGFKSKSGQSFAAYLIWENPAEAKLTFRFKKE
ncbi:DNA topoisomerase III [Desulfosporosinus orientis DSM 765]|uniref:DNA topoisomerase n=1 Tax=Desulfosporosinus orientis (strain ATCC 19365 / DSM 765 / NCIMB 8382 / VKM B-1628 / Singapore I) TaxID=768706 RepID=G7W5X7_DESOD|nr:DNA topoisomerase 3 [Desulfosporosinus orientis]AET67353.1 DNA topoisomerase III [Desulfosporosinus orientis DSM 765]